MSIERTSSGLLLAKIESVYGTDPIPTVANIIALSRQSLKYAPKFTHLTRTILDGTISKVQGANALPEVSVDFEVEIRGNRTDGTAPDISQGSSAHAIEIDPLLQACDLAPSYTAESSGGARDGNVIYKPVVSSNSEGPSVTIYWFSGGKLHKVNGCKGDLKLSLEAGQFGKLMFSFKGNYVAPGDAAIPGGITWLNTKPPIFVNSGSTIDSYSPVFQKLDADLGNGAQRRDDANSASGVKGFLITSRDSKCTIDPESVTEATSPIWADLAGGVSRVVSGAIGTQTGNKFTFTFKGVSDDVSYGDRSGIRTQPISYSVERANISDAPGDEFSLKFF